MKLHVHQGPLPVVPPYFDWDENFEIEVVLDDEEEIDLTDLFDRPTGVAIPN
jgi:hypothetical protein